MNRAWFAAFLLMNESLDQSQIWGQADICFRNRSLYGTIKMLFIINAIPKTQFFGYNFGSTFY